MSDGRTRWLQSSSVYEGPKAWLWFVGIARLVVQMVAAYGAYHFRVYEFQFSYFLACLYAVAFATSAAYLLALFRVGTASLGLTWTQTLLDFGMVALTVSATGGLQSILAFLLVIVVLEAGLLLGLAQGFVFASMATFLAAVQAMNTMALPATGTSDLIELWYRFLIQALAYYLAAFVTGHWNQRVRRMEQFEHDIIDNMNNGFLMTGPGGLILSQNRFADTLLNIPEGSSVGCHVGDVLRDASGSECPVVTALRTGRDFIGYEFSASLGNGGETRLLGLTTSLTRDAKGRVTGLIATFADLTEVERMRQELQSQDRLAVVGELAAGLAHEIRNPVAAIRGAVDELNGHLDSPAMVRTLAGLAMRESDHLNDIVTGFLDFARDPELQREAFDLRSLVNEVRALLHEECPAAVAERIVITVPDAPCVVSGAPAQLRQVFFNLGKNAFEAMGESGTLSISLGATSASYEIRFEDEGPGIAPDKVTRIFEPFYSEKEKGVGMGLAICSRIVTTHDGVIRAGSREQGGAVFTVRLPRTRRNV